LDALQERSTTFTGDEAEQVHRLIAQRNELQTQIDDLGGEASSFGHRIRVHGDYHLGQTLRTGNGFVLVDFEGEPARSLEERREKQSPLKDVAGMLRSFSYAAYAARTAAILGQPIEIAKNLDTWAAAWEASACSAFLLAYRAVLAGSNLLPAPAQQDALLRALLLEKASYELMYELNNRPAWFALPLRGLLTLSSR
jgi:maltose alpha-D-glucosyltransferase/alpha-amylase